MITYDKIMALLAAYLSDARDSTVALEELATKLDDLMLEEYERGQKDGPA
jgi:hypothetical protein